MGDLFASTSANQSQTQQQVGTQTSGGSSSVAIGGVSGSRSVGGGTQGSVATGERSAAGTSGFANTGSISVGSGANVGFTVNSIDPGALALAHSVLDEQQATNNALVNGITQWSHDAASSLAALHDGSVGSAITSPSTVQILPAVTGSGNYTVILLVAAAIVLVVVMTHKS